MSCSVSSRTGESQEKLKSNGQSENTEGNHNTRLNFSMVTRKWVSVFPVFFKSRHLNVFFLFFAGAGVPTNARTKTTDLFWGIQYTRLIFSLRKPRGRLSFVARQTFALLVLLFCASAYPPQADAHTSSKRAQNRGCMCYFSAVVAVPLLQLLTVEASVRHDASLFHSF